MTLETCLAELDHPDPERRLEAAQRVGQLCLAQPTPPFDEVLAALKARPPFGPNREPEPRVTEALFYAVREVASERGRRFGFKVERPSDLAAVRDIDLTWLVIQHVWDATTIYEDRRALRASLDLATPGQRALYALWWLDSEVHNGGLHQFLSNDGVLAPEVEQGLDRVGATDLAKVFRDTLALFPGGSFPTGYEDRQRALDEVPYAPFEELNSRYFDHGGDGLFRLTAAYVRAHPDEFFLD